MLGPSLVVGRALLVFLVGLCRPGNQVMSFDIAGSCKVSIELVSVKTCFSLQIQFFNTIVSCLCPWLLRKVVCFMFDLQVSRIIDGDMDDSCDHEVYAILPII